MVINLAIGTYLIFSLFNRTSTVQDVSLPTIVTAIEAGEVETLIVRGDSLVATKFDGSEEHFECSGQPNIEEALRAARRKVDRLEGPAVWNENYTDEELK